MSGQKFDERGIDIKGAMEDYVEQLSAYANDNAPDTFREYALAIAGLENMEELSALEELEELDDLRVFQYFEALATLLTQALTRAATVQRHY